MPVHLIPGTQVFFWMEIGGFTGAFIGLLLSSGLMERASLWAPIGLGIFTRLISYALVLSLPETLP